MILTVDLSHLAMCKFVFGKNSSGWEHFITNETLVPCCSSARVRPSVRLQFSSAARTLPAVSALQSYGAVLAAPLVVAGSHSAIAFCPDVTWRASSVGTVRSVIVIYALRSCYIPV